MAKKGQFIGFFMILLVLVVIVALCVYTGFSPKLFPNATNTTLKDYVPVEFNPLLPVISQTSQPIAAPAVQVSSQSQDTNSLPPPPVIGEMRCLHGVIVTDWKGKEWCVLNASASDIRNLSDYLQNQTAYNRTMNLTVPEPRYVYFKNCSVVPDGYLWNPDDFIVNSSHPLTCEQVEAWKHNDGYI
jgi:hypothetical protein